MDQERTRQIAYLTSRGVALDELADVFHIEEADLLEQYGDLIALNTPPFAESVRLRAHRLARGEPELRQQIYAARDELLNIPAIARPTQCAKGTPKVYLLRARGLNRYKIGYSRDRIEDRAKTIQAYSPIWLDVVAYRDGSMEDERWCHALLAPYRLHGEWFELPEDIVQDLMVWFVGLRVGNA